MDAKGYTLHGEDGYSRKGPAAGNASYYISQTRLEASGRLTAGGEAFGVTGLAWMDHEYSTSALAAGQVGWDWFSIQLDDGSELMLFELRKEDGTVDAFSSGTLIYPDGSAVFLGEADFTIEVEAWWDSPHSGARYPAQWIIAAPGYGIELSVEPVLADQELSVSFVYWEGSVRVSGAGVSGYGYVELTGYAHSMQGEF
jgi:predicted secreted hydrolase